MTTRKIVTYSATRVEQAGPVPVAARVADRVVPLAARQDVRNHSPDGFQWGYHGSGPAQLALALCLNALDYTSTSRSAKAIEQRAQRVYQSFKRLVIAPLTLDAWEMTSDDVCAIINAIEVEGEVDDTAVLRAVVNAHKPHALEVGAP